jgi:hypothetical protein
LIYPHNPIVTSTFGGVVFPLKLVHQGGGWQQAFDVDMKKSRYLFSALAWGGSGASGRDGWGGHYLMLDKRAVSPGDLGFRNDRTRQWRQLQSIL